MLGPPRGVEAPDVLVGLVKAVPDGDAERMLNRDFGVLNELMADMVAWRCRRGGAMLPRVSSMEDESEWCDEKAAWLCC